MDQKRFGEISLTWTLKSVFPVSLHVYIDQQFKKKNHKRNTRMHSVWTVASCTNCLFLKVTTIFFFFNTGYIFFFKSATNADWPNLKSEKTDYFS